MCSREDKQKATNRSHSGLLLKVEGPWPCIHKTLKITIAHWHVWTLLHHISSTFVRIPRVWWVSNTHGNSPSHSHTTLKTLSIISHPPRLQGTWVLWHYKVNLGIQIYQHLRSGYLISISISKSHQHRLFTHLLPSPHQKMTVTCGWRSSQNYTCSLRRKTFQSILLHISGWCKNCSNLMHTLPELSIDQAQSTCERWFN